MARLVPLLLCLVVLAATACTADDAGKALPGEALESSVLPPARVLKSRIAPVPPIVDRYRCISGNLPADPAALAESMAYMLTAALTETHRFVVLDRLETQTVLREHELAASGLMDPKTAPEPGRLIGAEFLAVPHVTDATIDTKVETTGFGPFRKTKTTVTVKIAATFSIINTSTSEVEISRTCEGVASAESKSESWNLGGFSVGETTRPDSPVGQAVKSCVDQFASEACLALGNTPWYSSVSEALDDRIYITGGADRAVQIGDRFEVVHLGTVLTDPVDGRVLDRIRTVCGLVQVTGVNDKSSVCEVLCSSQPIERGDALRDFACSWDGREASPEAAAEAEKDLRALVALAPDSADVKASLGAAEVMAGKMEQGRASIEEARALDPDSKAVLCAEATLKMALDDPEGAIELWGQVIAQGLASAAIHVNRGQAYLLAGRPEDARKDFERALALDPGSAALVNYSLGRACYEAGDYDGAVEAFANASIAAPDWPDPVLGQASALVRTGDSNRAFEMIDEMAKATPNALKPKLGRALLLEAQGKQRDAIRAYEQIVADGRSASSPHDQDAVDRASAALARLRGESNTPA